MCDSLAIATYLIRGTANEQLLGSDIEEQNQQLEWINFLREKTMPIVHCLKMLTFGHYKMAKDEYDIVLRDYNKNIKVFQAHLKTKRLYMVGANLTITDIFLTLTQIEMYQCIMDPKDRRYIPNVTKLFKHVTQDCEAFKARMGNIKICSSKNL